MATNAKVITTADIFANLPSRVINSLTAIYKRVFKGRYKCGTIIYGRTE
jgi:hypothetical protein